MITVELVKAEQKRVPPSAFDVPAGYLKMDP